jgi:hypothetical protein
VKRVSTHRGAIGLVLCCAVAFGACSPAPRPPDAQQDANTNDAATLDQTPAPDASSDDVFDGSEGSPDVVSAPDVADAPDAPDAPSAALWDMAEWDRGVWQ